MNRSPLLFSLILIATLSVIAVGQDKTKGSIKGTVRLENRSGVAGVTVICRQGDHEIARVETDRKGEFVISNLAPGNYRLTFRKSGLRTGGLDPVEVKAGKVKSLPDRLILKEDEGQVAFIRGSVFTDAGTSVPGVEVEIGLIRNDGSTRKIDSKITTESGQFAFRLDPRVANYRVTVKVSGFDPVSKDVEVGGAVIYSVALVLPPKP